MPTADVIKLHPKKENQIKLSYYVFEKVRAETPAVAKYFFVFEAVLLAVQQWLYPYAAC